MVVLNKCVIITHISKCHNCVTVCIHILLDASGFGALFADCVKLKREIRTNLPISLSCNVCCFIRIQNSLIMIRITVLGVHPMLVGLCISVGVFQGQFGEVYRGVFKVTGALVAIKTCRETLSEDVKRKFLQEGRILKQYDHPNIVKFIGIAAQRHPVMIVMEFVSGNVVIAILEIVSGDVITVFDIV